MWDRYDPQEENRDRRSTSDRYLGGHGCTRDRDRNEERDQSDPFTRALDLPRGPNREQVRDRDRVHELDGAHAGATAKSGFTCYLSMGCSVGGRGGGGRRTAHPRIAEELLR